MKTGILWGALVVVLDRVSKIWAQSALQAGSIAILPGVFSLTYAENTGMAFSLFSGYPRMLAVLSLALVIAVLLAMRGMLPKNRLVCALQGALLGGGIGNAIDRFVYGFVIDFIEPTFMQFAIFNVADTAVVISALALIFISQMRYSEGKNGGAQR